jgi:predicted RNA-binding Zn-ribbon protein involved in translation (DUF1610 family)
MTQYCDNSSCTSVLNSPIQMEEVGGMIDYVVYRCPRCGNERREDFHIFTPSTVTRSPEMISRTPRSGTIAAGVVLFALAAFVAVANRK